MKAETLNCPNCGAGVASDHSQCEFCRSRLKTVACPKCLGLMFYGTKFCGHCGALAVEAQAVEASTEGACPRCEAGLQSLTIETIFLSECKKCGGLWSDAETFEKICLDSERQSAAVSFFGNRPAPTATQTPIKYVPCPVCRQLMNRSNFARSSGVIIDLCKAHGVWFDAGELPKIIDFVDGGGLNRAREKDKAALDDERQKIRDERRQLGLSELRSGMYPSRVNRFEINGSDLFKALFDL